MNVIGYSHGMKHCLIRCSVPENERLAMQGPSKRTVWSNFALAASYIASQDVDVA